MITINQYLENKYSKSSLKNNLYYIKKFTDFYKNKAENATYYEVLFYIEHLRKNYNLHPKTLKNCLYAVKVYFNFLLEIGKRKEHPCSELCLKDKIDKQIQVENLYSPKALEKFFETYQIKQKKQLETRNKIIITLLIYQALTVNEIANLQLNHIDLNQCIIYIKQTKQNNSKSPKSRTLPLQANQVLLFYKYLTEDRNHLLKYNKNNPNETRFILGQYGETIHPHSINKIINENRRENEKIQPIKIRQSVIANLLKKENDTRIVQVFSGHRKAATTIQYKQTELEKLQKAVYSFHPIR